VRRLTNGGGEQLIDLAPDGSAVLFARFDEPSALWSLSLAGGEPRRLACEVSSEGAAFSPDGQRVLCVKLEEIDGRLFPRRTVVPAGGGEPLASFLLPPGATDVRWAPDGRAVTYIDRDTGFNLMRQAIAGGDATPLTRFDEGRLIGHEWSPDGKRIALRRQIGEAGSLWTLRPEGGKPERVSELRTGGIGTVLWTPDSQGLVFTYGTSSQDVVLITDFQ
jgi:dipeptidyl aminopeptidase/acylaminoacyl peptidase